MLGLVGLQLLYLLLIAIVVTLACLTTFAVAASGLPPSVITIVLYVGPPVVALIVTLFLLKPLLIRPPRSPLPIQLKREEEPLLFNFIDGLCRSLPCPATFADLRGSPSKCIRIRSRLARFNRRPSGSNYRPAPCSGADSASVHRCPRA